MNGWAERLPRVTIPLGDPKPVTLVLPYYECPQFFSVHCAHLRALPCELAEWLSVIVVDDGSPTKPLVLPSDRPCRMRAFRIDRDVPWNWLAARNIGAHQAGNGWLLVTDIDHVAPIDTLRRVIYGTHDPKVMYAFARREHTGEAIQPHSASFLLTRSLFWRIGGYDETLSGHYGSDGDWRRRAAKLAPIHLLSDELIRHEYVDDSSVKTLTRKLPSDTAAVKRLVAARGAGWAPKTLSFAYHEVIA